MEVVRGALNEGASLWLRVTGQSMSPLLREGDSVLLVKANSPAVGDVVFLDGLGVPLLHRLVSRHGDRVRTRGDACALFDPEVRVETVVGRAVLARRGEQLVALVPTARFGFQPLIRYAIWSLQVRLRLFYRWLRTRRHVGFDSTR